MLAMHSSDVLVGMACETLNLNRFGNLNLYMEVASPNPIKPDPAVWPPSLIHTCELMMGEEGQAEFTGASA
jgi:hypothetical protein